MEQRLAQVQKTPFYGYKNAVLLAYVYIATVGLIAYGFSVIFPVMINTLGWSRGDASWALSFSGMLSGIVLTPVAAIVINKIGVQKCITTGVVILLIGLFSLVTYTRELWHWYVIYGLLVPIGRALCGGLPMQVSIMTWFSRKRATVLGIVMTGAPFLGALAQPIYTWAMQITQTWKTGWMISGVFCVLALIASFWIKGKPSDLGQYPDGIAPADASATQKEQQTKGSQTYRTMEIWTIREVFKTRTIWIHMTMSVLYMFPFSMMTVHGVLHLTDLGYSAMQAANVLMLITFSSGAARFPMGWLGDRIEPRWIITVALCTMLIGLFGLWKAPSLSILMALGPVFGFSMGTLIILMAAIVPNYYGPETFASIRGYLTPPVTIITANFPALAGYIADTHGNYNPVFFGVSWCLVGAILCSFFLTPPQKKQTAAVESK